jgi:hypothetical protein
MVYLIPLERLMALYKPIYPVSREGTTDWAATKKFMLDSPADNRILKELMLYLEDNDVFRQGVSLEDQADRDYWNTAYPEEFDSSPLKIVDGTHRVVAYWMSGKTDVLVAEHVSAEEPSLLLNTEQEFQWLETFVEFTPGSVNFDDDDEAFETLTGYLRSFPLDEDHWLTSDCWSGNGDTLSLVWSIDPAKEKNLKNLMSDITDEISSLIRHYTNAKPLDVKTTIQQ